MVKVVIDPGHGGTDPGAVNGSYREKDFTLQIGLKVRDYLLSKYNVEILMTRTTDKTVSLGERTNYANNQNANYFCSIHINAGGGTGWESYIYNGSVSDKTIAAQNTIHSTVMGVIGSKYGVRDRGKKRANFHVLRESRMEAILLENLFIDTTADLNLLKSSAFITDLSNAIGEGIAKALSLSEGGGGTPGKLYKVIAGSFQERQNAVNRQNFLTDNGIEAAITTVVISGKTYYRVQAGAFKDKTNAQVRLDQVKALGITDAFILYE